MNMRPLRSPTGVCKGLDLAVEKLHSVGIDAYDMYGGYRPYRLVATQDQGRNRDGLTTLDVIQEANRLTGDAIAAYETKQA